MLPLVFNVKCKPHNSVETSKWLIETNRPLWVGLVLLGKDAICEVLVGSVGPSSEVESKMRIIIIKISFKKNQQP